MTRQRGGWRVGRRSLPLHHQQPGCLIVGFHSDSLDRQDKVRHEGFCRTKVPREFPLEMLGKPDCPDNARKFCSCLDI